MISPLDVQHNFEHDNFPIIYDFTAKIPVSVWNEECVIDFQEIYDYIRFLYE